MQLLTLLSQIVCGLGGLLLLAVSVWWFAYVLLAAYRTEGVYVPNVIFLLVGGIFFYGIPGCGLLWAALHGASWGQFDEIPYLGKIQYEIPYATVAAVVAGYFVVLIATEGPGEFRHYMAQLPQGQAPRPKRPAERVRTGFRRLGALLAGIIVALGVVSLAAALVADEPPLWLALGLVLLLLGAVSYVFLRALGWAFSAFFEE